jgi:hypothetical protein
MSPGGLHALGLSVLLMLVFWVAVVALWRLL